MAKRVPDELQPAQLLRLTARPTFADLDAMPARLRDDLFMLAAAEATLRARKPPGS